MLQGHADDSPGGDPDLTSGTLSHAGLDNVAHVDLLDAVRLDIGLVQRVLDGDNAELGRRETREGAVDRADGRAGGRNDVDGLGGLGGESARLKRSSLEFQECCCGVWEAGKKSSPWRGRSWG